LSNSQGHFSKQIAIRSLSNNFDMATQSLRRRTIDSAIWTLLGYGASQILRFGSNLILASILEPQFFGLMAIINILLVGIVLFSDVGIAQSIINNSRGEERDFLDTAWTAQVMRGFMLWGFCLLITIPAAQFYQDDRLLTFIPVAGIASVIEGFQTTRVFVAQRRLEQRRYSMFELSSLIMGVVTMVSLAFLLRNVWALILAGLFQALFITIAGYFFFPGPRHRFCWDSGAVKSLVSLGRWIFFASATMFMAEQVDRLILAKLVDWKTIGVYSIAYNLSNVPKELIKTLSYRVIYPAVAQQVDLPRRDLQAKIAQQRQVLLAGCAVILALLVTSGDLVISVLYNEKYANAIWMMPILCGGIWFSVLFNSMNNVLVAINKPLYSAYCYAARLVIVSSSLILGFRLGGLPGAVLAISLSDLPTYLVNLYGLRQEKLSCIRQDLIFTVFFVVVLAFCLGVRYWLGFGQPLQRLMIA
jgi:O-antigen/teichoic acid export membrane protein